MDYHTSMTESVHLILHEALYNFACEIQVLPTLANSGTRRFSAFGHYRDICKTVV